MSEYTYRTFNLHPSDYERELADALFEIMGRSVHELDGVVVELNRAGIKPNDGRDWTVDSFEAEMRRLGTWSNSIGAPVGAHGVPGASRRARGQ